MRPPLNLGCKGINDNPSSKDLFGITNYTNGLSTFIATCNCPMTIAIQGDWGTGKTSMMQRIKGNSIIASNCVTVDLNTWEYSQFDLGNNLPIVFYTALIEKMGGSKASSDITDNVRNAIKGIMLFGLSFAEKTAAGSIMSLIAGATKAGAENIDVSKGNKTLVEATEELKSNFEKVLKARLNSEKDKDRMIIFIDDLDRIEPKRAVELMEILKVLLEVDHCVFILAIDYDVVVRGIKAKYGSDMDERKARSFFDKIIQVPFSLPVGSYNIEQYVSSLLKGMQNNQHESGLLKIKNDDNNSKDKEVTARDEVIDLIRYSVGCNPRAIKRLINSFSLLSLIKEENNKITQATTTNDEEIILFASLCLQLAYDRVYDYLLSVRNSKESVESLFNLLTSFNPADVENKSIYDKFEDKRMLNSLRLEDYSESELYQLNEYFDQFLSLLLLSSENDNEDTTEDVNEENRPLLSDENFESLKNALKFASSTSSDQDNMETSDKLPAKIMHIYRVVEEVLKNKKSLSEATKYVATNTLVSGKPISRSAVSDKYTRQLGNIHTKDFEELLNKYKNGDDELIEKIKENNQDRYRDLIDIEFSKLNTYRSI